MTSQLMKKVEREKLSELFRAFDKNSDGKIDKAELKDGYNNLMGKIMSDDEVESIFTKIDIDSSGFIDYNEFLGAAMSMETMMSEERLRSAFAMFD
jgi:calcium-dependent protein kinase